MPDCAEAGHPALDEEEGMHPAEVPVDVTKNPVGGAEDNRPARRETPRTAGTTKEEGAKLYPGLAKEPHTCLRKGCAAHSHMLSTRVCRVFTVLRPTTLEQRSERVSERASERASE